MADQKLNNNDADKFVAPKWINVDLIQRALKNGGEHNLQVNDLTVRLGTAPGYNYASIIYRVTVALSNGSTRSLLVKGPPPGDYVADLIKDSGTFRREGYVLAEIVPQIQALLEEAAPEKFPQFAARCPLYDTDPVELLVLEDLAPQGFKMADRKRGLGLRHSLLALRTLARYHAASHVLLQRKPEVADELPSMWVQSKEMMINFLQNGLRAAAEAYKAWSGFEEYAEFFEKFTPIAMKNMIKHFQLKPGEFTVILHGDFWVNNMMFQYKNGEPRGHRMVDFQISTVGSPTLDVLYFLSTSVTDEVSAHHEDLLVREYHHELKETLALLGVQAPTLQELLADMNAHGSYSLLGTVSSIPIVRAQREIDIEATLAGNVSAITHLYDDPAVKKWMQRVLPEYKRKGWLPC